jgi:hypothetical protein
MSQTGSVGAICIALFYRQMRALTETHKDKRNNRTERGQEVLYKTERLICVTCNKVTVFNAG